MKATSSSIEVLESRIAPASAVTTTFVAGVLTIDQTDGLDHTLEIVQVSKTAFQVRGTNTTIDGADSKDFSGALTGIVFIGGAGDDSLTLKNLGALATVTFAGNAGSDFFEAQNVKVKGTVGLDLGADYDTVIFSGATTLIGGVLNLNYGADGGEVTFQASNTTLSGTLNITGGAGDDSFSLAGGYIKVAKSINFTGNGGVDELTATANKLTIGAELGVSVNYTGGDVEDTLALKPITLVTSGAVTFNGGDGTNLLNIGAATATLGKNGTGQSVVLTGGADDDLLLVDCDVVSTKGSLELLGDTNGGGTNEFVLRATVSGKLAKSAAGNSIVVLGDFTDTASTVDIQGSLITLAGNLSMKDVDGDAQLNIVASTFKVTGGVTMESGAGLDQATIQANGSVSGSVSLNLGASTADGQQVTVTSALGTVSGLKIGVGLTVTSSSTFEDDVTLTNISVGKGVLSVTTGSGVSVLDFDNVVANAGLTVDTGAGNDEFNFEVDSFFGASTVKGLASIIMGAGDDTLTIGNSTAPALTPGANSKVNFLGAVSLDGDNGTNAGTGDVLNSSGNTFAAGAPTTKNFETIV